MVKIKRIPEAGFQITNKKYLASESRYLEFKMFKNQTFKIISGFFEKFIKKPGYP